MPLPLRDVQMSNFNRPNRYRAPAFTRATQLGPPKSDLERDSGFSG